MRMPEKNCIFDTAVANTTVWNITSAAYKKHLILVKDLISSKNLQYLYEDRQCLLKYWIK